MKWHYIDVDNLAKGNHLNYENEKSDIETSKSLLYL